MARNDNLVKRERHDIHNAFSLLFDEKEHGVRKYTLDWIYAEIGKRFYKTPRTIKAIISKPCLMENSLTPKE